MAEMKHSPGPWICDSATFDFEGARYGEVAYVLSKEGEAFVASSANSRLIAAAPDLLEACMAYVKAYDETTGTIHVNHQMRKAIAKATNKPADSIR